MELKVEPLSVEKLFGDRGNYYQIPIYQRPYRWEDEQVEQLWSDIMDSFEETESNNEKKDEKYFLGSIIIKAKENDKFDIVDGQQRMTTLTILFCVLRDLYSQNGQITNTSQCIKDIQEFICKDDDRLIINPAVKYASDIRDLIRDSLSITKKPLQAQVRKDEEPEFKFKNTYFIFKQKMLELEKEKGIDFVGKFIDYIFKQVEIIRIICQNEEQAMRIFRVMNDRGLDLSTADLIKSILLEKIRNEKIDETRKNEKINEFMQSWEKSQDYLSECDSDMEYGFLLYAYKNSNKHPRGTILKVLENYFKDKDSLEAIREFEKMCQNYKEYIGDKEDKHINSLFYLRWDVHWKIILLKAIEVGYEDFDGLVKVLRRYYYLNWIAGYSLDAVRGFSFEIKERIQNQESIYEIRRFVDEQLKNYKNKNVIDEAKQSINAPNIYKATWIKPLLILVEYEQTDDSKQNFIELDNKLHIDHIFPQNPKDLSGYKDVEYLKENVNSIKNLTLLSGRKNTSKNNKNFEKSIEIYKGQGTNKGTTAFEITKKIIDDYDIGKFNKRWGKNAMDERMDWICECVYDLLEIPY